MNVPDSYVYHRNYNELTTGTPYPANPTTIDYTAEEVSENEKELLTEIWADPGLQWMPEGDSALKGKEVTTTGETYHWYLPENARGNGTATSQYEKNADTAPSGQGSYCTYIEIKGYFKSAELVTAVTYNIYLGGNNTTDYNILRNRNYTVTTTIQGIDRADTRIDEETFKPQNYLDYTDNSMPWFVVAARDKGNTNMNSLNAPAGWEVPTKKDFMLCWVYKLNSDSFSNIYWVKEGIDANNNLVEGNGQVANRWSVNMGNGKTIIGSQQGDGDNQDYILRTIQSTSSSYKYPYIEGGKGESNIIVSRDLAGGVKAESLRDPETDPWETTPAHSDNDIQNTVAYKFEVGTHPTIDEQQTRRIWDNASNYCANEYRPGETGWRIPTQRELMLIYAMNDQLEDPLLSMDPYDPGTNHVYYWSATQVNNEADESNTAWSICFCTDNPSETGKVNGYTKDANNYVRCVRDVTD